MSDSSNMLKMLEEKVVQLMAENRALKASAKNMGDERVTVRFSGYGPSIVVVDDDGKSYVFSNAKGQTFHHLPLDVYLQLKNSVYFEMGYLYTDDDLDNPNLILDVDSWFEGKTERALKSAVEEITSPGALNMLYNFTEEGDDAKTVYLRDRVTKKINEVMNINLVEDTPE